MTYKIKRKGNRFQIFSLVFFNISSGTADATKFYWDLLFKIGHDRTKGRTDKEVEIVINIKPSESNAI